MALLLAFCTICSLFCSIGNIIYLTNIGSRLVLMRCLLSCLQSMYNLNSAKLTPQEFISGTSLSRRRSNFSMRGADANASQLNLTAAASSGYVAPSNTVTASRKVSTSSAVGGT